MSIDYGSLTHDRLRELLEYNSETGKFVWRVGRMNGTNAGDVAGSNNSKGYVVIGIGGKIYPAHRLAWLYVHERWPANQIDHINGIRDDNRLCNLRDATVRENGQNRREHREGRLPGVHWSKASQRFKAQISINGKQHSLGYYKTELEAHKAYVRATEEVLRTQQIGRAA